jgi:hypothetical protein
MEHSRTRCGGLAWASRIVGADGNGEFQGTLLVPNGSPTINFAGHSGHVIVGVDLRQDKAGSELHSYEYNPVCPLPLPPCVEATPLPTTKNPTPGS